MPATQYRKTFDSISYGSGIRSIVFHKFKSSFPNWEDMRNAISHRAEIFSMPEKIKSDTLSGHHDMPGIAIRGGKYNIVEGLMDMSKGTYTTTFKGRPISFELSASTFDKLKKL